ncbi:MAG: phage holin family protein [Frankia sp.]
MTSVSNGRGAAGELSLGDLVATATRDMSLLVRQEIELAKAELGRQAISAGLGAAFLAVAGGLAFCSLIAVTIFFGELFTWAGLERFWSYLVTAGMYLLIAGVLGLLAKTRLSKLKPPARTLQTVRDDVAFLRHPTSAGRAAQDPAAAETPTAEAPTA